MGTKQIAFNLWGGGILKANPDFIMSEEKSSPIGIIVVVAAIAVVAAFFVGKSGGSNGDQAAGNQQKPTNGTDTNKTTPPPEPPKPGKPAEPKEPAFVKEGLVAYYPFNGNAKDESGNGNDGQVKEATLTADRHGKAGKAYSFKGKSTVDCGKDWADQIKNRISFAAWVSNSHLPNDRMIVNKDPRGPPDVSWFLGIVEGHPNLRINGQSLISPTLSPLGGWYHIAGTYDGKSLGLYVNGTEVANKQISEKVAIISTSDINVHLGSSNGSYYFFEGGSIDDVRIYNRALSEAEVKELYELEKPKE